MKLKFILVSQIFLLLFIACGNEETLNSGTNFPEVENLINISSQEYVSIAFDNPKELNESEAGLIAKNFIIAQEEIQSKDDIKTKSQAPQFQVKSKYYIGMNHADSKVQTKSSAFESKANNIPLYEMEIHQDEGKGLIIVSGDERAQKVIAYIPKFNDEDINSGVEYMMEVSKKSLLENIEEVEHIKDSLRESTIEKIAAQLKISPDKFNFNNVKNYLSIDNEPLSKANPIRAPPTQILAYVETMCKTSWGQDRPYNNGMPEGIVQVATDWYQQDHYMAGCGVIAVAQIIAALEPNLSCYGVNMEWSYLKERPQINELIYFPTPGVIYDEQRKLDMVGKFIRFIYEGTASFPNKDSQNRITSVSTYNTKADEFIKKYANGSSIVSYNPDQIRNSLLAHRLVLAMGWGTKTSGKRSDHAFILDGYLMCRMYTGTRAMTKETSTKELVKIYDLYFHANFGWHGAGDGYYLINKDTSVDFATNTNEGAVYKTANLQFVTDIRLK